MNDSLVPVFAKDMFPDGCALVARFSVQEFRDGVWWFLGNDYWMSDEYLARLDLKPNQPAGLNVAYHSACSLQHGQKIVREPKAFRAYRVPFSIPVGEGSIPIPSLIALLGAVAALIGVVIYRHTATVVGGIWLLLGIALYVAYRKFR